MHGLCARCLGHLQTLQHIRNHGGGGRARRDSGAEDMAQLALQQLETHHHSIQRGADFVRDVSDVGFAHTQCVLQ